MSVKCNCKADASLQQVSKKTPRRHKDRNRLKRNQPNPPPTHLSKFLKKLSFDALRTVCSVALWWLKVWWR